jgi:phage terminase large subunit-like protein
LKVWDFSCPDWQDRIRAGRSLMPALPLFESERDQAVAFFDGLRLPDVLGEPLLRDACGEWYRDIVRAVFGSRDPATNVRYVREVFALVGKGASKTTYSAALMLVALLMNVRRRVEFHLLAPVQKTAEQSYDSVKGMIESDPQLDARFHCRDHRKEIVDRINRAKLCVKTFDLKTMTGPKPAGVMIDELHLLAKSAHTTKVLRQIRGGLEKSTDGFLLIVTSQSDDRPVGAFEAELKAARGIRDGRIKGRLLPLLYEFPADIATDESKWKDPANWPMVMPNLGKSLQLDSLIADLEGEKEKGLEQERLWYSQHLSVEIGIGLAGDRWAGAEFWQGAIDPDLGRLYEAAPFDALFALLDRSELAVVGFDGGGLDDLAGLTVLGREPDEIEVEFEIFGKVVKQRMKRWLSWSHAWCHKGVLDRRKSIAAKLTGLAKRGELTMVGNDLIDVASMVEIVRLLKDRKKLGGVAVDPAGLSEFADALEASGLEISVENKMLFGAPQGYAMMNAIKTCERRVAKGMLLHCGGELMPWCVGNLKIEPTATAIRATKMNVGDAKIDPAMAQFNAATLMSTNPQPARVPTYQVMAF